MSLVEMSLTTKGDLMKPTFIATVFVSLIQLSCGIIQNDQKKDSFGNYDCGGPTETPYTGSEASLSALKRYTFAQNIPATNRSTPSKVLWYLSFDADAPQLHLGEKTYTALFNEQTNKWDLRLSSTDETSEQTDSVGSLYPFNYTLESSHDEFHCITNGFKFEVLHEGTNETYTFMHGII